MAVRQHSAPSYRSVQSGHIDVTLGRNPAYFGGNIPYQYHPHANTSDPQYYTSLEVGTAIRQPQIPRLHIPSLALPRPPLEESPTFPSGVDTQPSAKYYSPVRESPKTSSESREDQRPGTDMEKDKNPEASMSTTVPAKASDSARPRRRTSSSAVIACRQCRTRKIRCDSMRPGCANCQRRADQCEYDPAPKRRGPDKRPGTRQRRCKPRVEEQEPRPRSVSEEGRDALKLENPIALGSPPRSIALPSPVQVPAAAPVEIELEEGRPAKRRRRERDTDDDRPRQLQQPAIVSVPSHAQSYDRANRHISHPEQHGQLRISTDEAVLLRRPQPSSSSAHPTSSRYDTTPLSSGYALDFTPRPVVSYDLGEPGQGKGQAHPKFPHPPPAVQAAQQVWWEAFLRSYSLREIANDLNFLYNETAALSFVNVGFLLEALWSPTRYLTLQPAFILASMALAMLIRSSEAERGTGGRERAAFLRDSAQAALELAWREGVWLDASLAEAALILVVYMRPPLTLSTIPPASRRRSGSSTTRSPRWASPLSTRVCGTFVVMPQVQRP